MHELSNNIAAIQATLTSLEKNINEVHAEVISHMAREERSFDKIYTRLKHMDDSIVDAFKERDQKIAQVDKATVKLAAYAVSAMTVATIVVNIIMRVFL